MSEGRRAFVVGLGLMVLVVVLQLGGSALGDKRGSSTPTASATPTVVPTSASASGCPAALKLPDGVDARVCQSVAAGDLTALRPTKDSSSGKSIVGFRSPSGSIACTDVRGQTVACAVKGWTFDAGNTPRGETVVLSAGRPLPSADLRLPTVAVETPGRFAVPGLQFGQFVRMNDGWFCGVQEVGVSCWSPTARSGLLVSRSQWTTWSPAGIERAS